MYKNDDILKIAKLFDIIPQKISPCGNGHIHDTYCIETEKKKFLLQRINDNVFTSPEDIVNNILRITYFLENKGVQTLHIIPTMTGAFCLKMGESYWRMYNYIENAVCLDSVKGEDLYRIALGFGEFQQNLNGFDAKQLFVPIKNFHNTPVRYKNLMQAAETDKFDRLAFAEDEMNFFNEHSNFYSLFNDEKKKGNVPLRVTHNDTKCNNVMLDASTKRVKCVIDLDTVMPGFAMNDFGDMVRFAANTASEDERDLTKVNFDFEAFKNCVDGFLDGCGKALNGQEVNLLCEGAKMMALECGMRFLEDYLRGDVYFKTQYEDHNLVRCRTQIKLVKDMESMWDEMKQTVKASAEKRTV